RFKFSLASGEIIECEPPKCTKGMFVVRSVSQFTSGYIDIGLVSVKDARKKSDVVVSGGFLRLGTDKLRQSSARKVVVGPLGEVVTAND
ncbi:MAG: hypothetical protein ACRD10_03675, partial [Terriglobia bacterium]